MKTLIYILGLSAIGGAGYYFYAPQNVAAPAGEEVIVTQQENNVQEEVEEEYVILEEDMVSLNNIAPVTESQEQSVLAEKELEWLVHMREEEKLARDVYLAMYEQWGLNLFSNIAGSEQTHTTAVQGLLERYGITDPVANDVKGVFVNEELQALYNQLVSKGSVSLVDALIVGATIEDLDIKDLQKATAVTTQTDIIAVYENLSRGSRNHMRAFNKQLIQQTGESYQAQYLSQSELDAILAAEQERGSGGGGNGGGGNGNGGGGNGRGQ